MGLNLFKRKKTIDYVEVFTGKVRFIHGSKVIYGEVFGKPYNLTLLGPLTYHVLGKDGKVYEIPHHALERAK